MTADAGSSDDHAAKGPISFLAARACTLPRASSGPGSSVAALMAGLPAPTLLATTLLATTLLATTLLATIGPMAMQPGAPAIGRREC